MSEEKYTRCPGCSTVFRVTAEQLAVRSGQVRCGQCKTVFDGVAQQVSLSAPVAAAGSPPYAPLAGPAAAAQSPAAAAIDAAADEIAAAGVPPPGAEAGTGPGDEGAAIARPGTAGASVSVDRFAAPVSAAPRGARVAAYIAVIAVLLLLVAGQAAYHFRDAIVTFWPAARPAFTKVCAVAGCAIRPMRDAAMTHLSIESSDLQADPAHRGLLILTATVRNRAGWTLAYPHLELTLTDTQDQVVVRRALAPAEYAAGTADLARGIAANAEIAIKVFIDASAISPAGYRLYIFYP